MGGERGRPDRLSPAVAQQPRAGMIVEALDIVHVLAQHVERLVPRLRGHLEDAGASARGGGQKPSTQAMTGVGVGGLETGLGGTLRDDERDALGG